LTPSAAIVMKRRLAVSRVPGKAKAKPKAAARTGRPSQAATKSTAKPSSKSAPKGEGAAKDKPILADADWRVETIERMRRLIKQADPEAVEEVKWRKPSNAMMGVPTWSHDGLICTGETYKDKVKFTFAQGAALDDATGLFNAKDTGATRRAIDLHAGDQVDETAFKALVRAAVAFNQDN
jgi:hypothetical protein